MNIFFTFYCMHFHMLIKSMEGLKSVICNKTSPCEFHDNIQQSFIMQNYILTYNYICKIDHDCFKRNKCLLCKLGVEANLLSLQLKVTNNTREGRQYRTSKSIRALVADTGTKSCGIENREVTVFIQKMMSGVCSLSAEKHAYHCCSLASFNF